MRRSAGRFRVVSVSVVILVAAGLASCHTSGVAPVPIRLNTVTRLHEVYGAAPARVASLASDTTLDTMTIRTTPPLNRYIEQLDDTAVVRYLNSLGFDMNPQNSEIENAECVHATNNTPCILPESAQVRITPEIGSHKWSYNSIGQYGLIVAMVSNLDQTDRMERNFGFPANTRVFWVVDRDPATHNLRSRYFKRNYSSTAPAVDQVGITRPFIYCDHQHKQGHSVAIAKYVSCSQSLTMSVPSDPTGVEAVSPVGAPSNGLYRLASFPSAVRLPAHPEIMALRATWVTCAAGCCSTSP